MDGSAVLSLLPATVSVAMATIAGGVLTAIVSGRFTRLTARDTAKIGADDRRDERFSVETQRLLEGYREDMKSLRAELKGAEKLRAEQNAENRVLIGGLNTTVQDQRTTMFKQQDDLAAVSRENFGLRVEVERLTKENAQQAHGMSQLSAENITLRAVVTKNELRLEALVRENKALRLEVARLMGLAADAEAETAGEV